MEVNSEANFSKVREGLMVTMKRKKVQLKRQRAGNGHSFSETLAQEKEIRK